jgi:hypothetical protein
VALAEKKIRVCRTELVYPRVCIQPLYDSAVNPLIYFRGRARQAGIAALIVVIAGSAVWFVRGRSMVSRKTLPPGGQGWWRDSRTAAVSSTVST